MHPFHGRETIASAYQPALRPGGWTAAGPRDQRCPQRTSASDTEPGHDAYGSNTRDLEQSERHAADYAPGTGGGRWSSAMLRTSRSALPQPTASRLRPDAVTTIRSEKIS
jgi:hypothetical protein